MVNARDVIVKRYRVEEPHRDSSRELAKRRHVVPVAALVLLA